MSDDFDMVAPATDALATYNAGLTDAARRTRDLDASTRAIGRSLTNAFAGGVAQGKRFDDILRNVGRSLSEVALKAALKPLETAFTSSLSGLLGGAGGGGGLVVSNAGGFSFQLQENARGNVFDAGSVRPFAAGGVIASPTYFPTSGSSGPGLGVMGERGAEAVMPLARGADGRLGVRAGGGGAAPVSVTVNIATPDPEGFRRSEAQIAGALARAVARGNRAL